MNTPSAQPSPSEKHHAERIRARAEQIWREKGEPAGGPDLYLDEATELVAIEENFQSTLLPIEQPNEGPYGEPIEPIEALENEGEFPTLTDQGEGDVIPHRGKDPNGNE